MFVEGQLRSESVASCADRSPAYFKLSVEIGCYNPRTYAEGLLRDLANADFVQWSFDDVFVSHVACRATDAAPHAV